MLKNSTYKKFLAVGFLLLMLLPSAHVFAEAGLNYGNASGTPTATSPLTTQTTEGANNCNHFWSDLSVTCIISNGLQAIGVLFSWFLGIGLRIASWFVNIALDLNFRILGGENALVTTGWDIVRDIANLGFVIVIIIIAIATIIRREEYGMQKLLPKLIAAAILVNFSLTIAGVFIDFSNVLTKFFMSRVGDGSSAALTDAVAGAFAPQRFLAQTSAPSDISRSVSDNAPGLGTATVVGIMNLLFIIAFMLIAILVHVVFSFMLLLRYLWLSFLLLISPIVWLFWVIPDLSKNFGKWWSKFFEWIFFAPAMTFFVYLSLFAAQKLGQLAPSSISDWGTTFQNIVSQGAQMIILAGIMFGGLIMAKKFGIDGAESAIKFAGSVGGNVRSWAGRQALRGATRVTNAGPVKKLTEKMQAAGTGEGGGVMRRTGRLLARVTGGAAVTREAGLALSKFSGQREKLPEQEFEKYKGLSDDRLVAALPMMSDPARAQALEQLAKRGRLGSVPNVQSLLTKDTEKIFKSFGKSFGGVEKSLGMNIAMADALKSGDVSTLNIEAQKFYEGMSAKDREKIPANAIFGEFDPKKPALGLPDEESLRRLQQSILYGVAIKNSGDLAHFYKTVTPKNSGNLDKALDDVIPAIQRRKASKDEKEEEIKAENEKIVANIKKLKTRLIKKRVLGEFADEKEDEEEEEPKKDEKK